jgi:hypothetical protein
MRPHDACLVTPVTPWLRVSYAAKARSYVSYAKTTRARTRERIHTQTIYYRLLTEMHFCRKLEYRRNRVTHVTAGVYGVTDGVTGVTNRRLK